MARFTFYFLREDKYQMEMSLNNEYEIDGKKYSIAQSSMYLYVHPGDEFEYSFIFSDIAEDNKISEGDNIITLIFVSKGEVNSGKTFTHRTDDPDFSEEEYLARADTKLDYLVDRDEFKYDMKSESGTLEVKEIDFDNQYLEVQFEYRNEDGIQVKGSYKGNYEIQDQFGYY